MAVLYAVCRSWRDSRSQTPVSRAQVLSWLLAPPSGDPTAPLRFRCVLSRRSYHASPPSARPPCRNWVSTPDGTTVRYLTVDERRCPSLRDPLTGAAATESMPPFTWQHWEGSAAKFRAALLRPGDIAWTLIERTLAPPPTHRGEFCAAYQAGKILVTVKPAFWRVIMLNGNSDDVVTDVLVPKPWTPRRDEAYTYQSSYVLESRGELLWASVQVVRRNYNCEERVDGRGLLHFRFLHGTGTEGPPRGRCGQGRTGGLWSRLVTPTGTNRHPRTTRKTSFADGQIYADGTRRHKCGYADGQGQAIGVEKPAA
uniref:DUF295 domain-containing protein n=1 Tax=Aegilops tauschii TaxID=37682 RepID=R7WB42_AEGTA